MMDSGAAIEAWIAETLGLDTASIGKRRLEQVIASAMNRCGIADGEAYLKLLSQSPEEAERCLEELVVPETWFFRDREPFLFLQRYLHQEWLPAHPDQILRILSVPCSTGEEPYSIAMTLLEAGLSADRFRLDAADISRRALAAAREAVYGRSSFRQPLSDPHEIFFRAVARGKRITRTVTRTVRFSRANLITPGFLADEAPYHIIFCRNIFIYLNQEARRQVLANLDRLLAPEGLLFTGHSEVGYLQQQGYAALRHPRAFVCRKAEKPKPAASPVVPEIRSRRPASPLPPVPATRRQTTAAGRASLAPKPAPPTAAGSLHAKAQALADRGLFAEAAELCRRHIREERPHADVYCLLGLIHEAARRPSEAEACYLKALYLDPDHYETLIQASLLYRHQGNDRKARLYRRRAEAQQQRRFDGTSRS